MVCIKLEATLVWCSMSLYFADGVIKLFIFRVNEAPQAAIDVANPIREALQKVSTLQKLRETTFAAQLRT